MIETLRPLCPPLSPKISAVLVIRQMQKEYNSKTLLTQEDIWETAEIAKEYFFVDTGCCQYKRIEGGRYCHVCKNKFGERALCCLFEAIKGHYNEKSCNKYNSVEIIDFGLDYILAVDTYRITMVVNQNFNLADFLQYLQKQEAIKWQK